MECPIKGKRLETCPKSNEELDPNTQMPKNLGSITIDESTANLSADRIASSIPRAGTETTWQYPSARMFYAALERKGKGAPIESIPAMLAIHNALNESVWDAIVERERYLYNNTQGRGSSQEWKPKLKRFCGRPEDQSPRAWWHVKVRGGEPPFDRHDWIIEREGGEEIRYVIDYYGAPSEAPGEAAFNVDIRPAIDKPKNLLDRIRLYWGGFK